MDVGNPDALILPVPPEPFALIVGAAMQGGSSEAVETALRRMGLRPERVEGEGGGADVAARVAAPCFRLTFGAVSVLAGPAAGAALDLADPDHPSTSLLAASLPRRWRESGACWVFIPERDPKRDAALGPSTVQPTRMREFFKMMVLLIDLFDASHIFWSPARLWSDAPQFRASIAEMLASGMPPVLHLVAFRRRENGADASMGTRGLVLFAGQELEARIPVGWTVAEMVRRLSRLALDMMLNGPVQHARTMRGLEAGEWIELLPPLRSTDHRSTVIVEFGRDS
ncbi:hypothetical protein ATE68_02215 [Sphingopyxis sp. H038]|uniref:hypothetical protein n=1 Tax=unclassified Sphingopyxis TaxID=2614943 RepID=UPI0007310A6D|nr:MULTISPECIES: hypothetical protein [unclassified Sphingopyxis]KTE04478.1 hypothetical protein ATE78_02220 [Sphingopyxis sp. H012]KTE13322.1 hypothetical protein ATE70_01205 [Sphingopyxis sp. H053]KTE14509.1 hypothetical protein ATE76_08765 [Sphingopyxis sp. H093]KTE31161.1 hypothetical protein ATE75_01180 [Sphingopyxis sp. H080]KTE36967.1 hypothetical protein ATE68_02215 [Sphingopyxis sp. H038]